MAVYGTDIKTGIARGGNIAFTGWTGILADGGTVIPNAAGQGPAGNVSFNGVFQHDDQFAKFFRKSGPALKQLRSMLFALVGAAAGAASTTNVYKRVQAQDLTVPGGNDLGGLRVIENVGYTTRATTAADRDAFREMITRNVFPTTGALSAQGRVMSYPRDLSGVGGGGKVNF